MSAYEQAVEAMGYDMWAEAIEGNVECLHKALVRMTALQGCVVEDADLQEWAQHVAHSIQLLTEVLDARRKGEIAWDAEEGTR